MLPAVFLVLGRSTFHLDFNNVVDNVIVGSNFVLFFFIGQPLYEYFVCNVFTIEFYIVGNVFFQISILQTIIKRDFCHIQNWCLQPNVDRLEQFTTPLKVVVEPRW